MKAGAGLEASIGCRSLSSMWQGLKTSSATLPGRARAKTVMLNESGQF